MLECILWPPHFGYVVSDSLENGSRVVGHVVHLFSTGRRGTGGVNARAPSKLSRQESCATPFSSPDPNLRDSANLIGQFAVEQTVCAANSISSAPVCDLATACNESHSSFEVTTTSVAIKAIVLV